MGQCSATRWRRDHHEIRRRLTQPLTESGKLSLNEFMTRSIAGYLRILTFADASTDGDWFDEADSRSPNASQNHPAYCGSSLDRKENTEPSKAPRRRLDLGISEKFRSDTELS